MGTLRAIRAFLTSRWLWSAIGVLCLAALVWVFGPFLGFAEARPLADEIPRLAVIAALVLGWLVWSILRQRRAIRANRLFVTDLAVQEIRPTMPGQDGLAAVETKFARILDELRRRKLGGRRLLRDMPWYVIIGPPAAGKTTALRQSGLTFPFDLTDDLRGVGGTRDCDWFFTEDAVLIDTAGRYVTRESAPEADAAEWLGFLDLLRKHRGRRALNGVLLALPVDLLAEGEAAIRAHGREIRKRLAEIEERLRIRLPVYLLLTKADLIRGFEPTFDPLSREDREQVWGATFAPAEVPDGAMIARELGGLVRELDARTTRAMEAEEDLAARAEIFRFPAQVASLEGPLRILVDTIFGQSRYDTSSWLRGFYLTSATQEGTPIDRLVGGLAAGFGLSAAPALPSHRVERRSFFLRRLLTDVIFPEAGLATLDPEAEERRLWLRRGAAVAAGGLAALAAVGFLASYLANRGLVAAQVAAFDRLAGDLAPVAARQVPVEPSDLDVALAAVTAVGNARVAPPPAYARLIGPSAAAEIDLAQASAYDRALRDILEPRMVALLEATMWRNIRDADFLLGALKSYRMMTGPGTFDPAYLQAWWVEALPAAAAVDPFPTEAALSHQMAAIGRMASDQNRIAPDEALLRQALTGVCAIPLSRRAYEALLADPAVMALPEWTPAAYAGPNGGQVFVRRSGKTLRQGIPGAFTRTGFQDTILPRLPDVAAQAALDRSVFAGGCDERAAAGQLAEDMLKLYADDVIAQWDGLLRDITLAPITDLNVANANLKDLVSPDSALRRLLTAAADATDLARPAEGETPAADAQPPTAGILAKLGKLGKIAKTCAKFIPGADEAPTALAGQAVSDHFRSLRSTVSEVDGAPPALDAATASLTALSGMLQQVAANPNREQALLRQGGLAELIGTVDLETALLPDPLDDWLDGLGGLQAVTTRAVTDRLNAIWRADVLPFCKDAADVRYPFNASASLDVLRQDFQRLFGPGGLIDTYTNEQLLPYIDTGARPWQWRGDLGLDPGALGAFEQARGIRDALFPGGVGPIIAFRLQPTDLSPNAASVSLVIDNQPLTYFNSATPPVQMTWPGKDMTDSISLTFRPMDGSPDVMVSETGTWAFLRLLRKNGLQPTGQPELFRLKLAAGGYSATFDLMAGSIRNPFDLSMFSSFTCPDHL